MVPEIPQRKETEQAHIIACIEHKDEAIEGGFHRFWNVLCFNGTYVLKVCPPHPHALGWEDYQDAYRALFEVYPKAELIGTENWYISAIHSLQNEQPLIALTRADIQEGMAIVHVQDGGILIGRVGQISDEVCEFHRCADLHREILALYRMYNWPAKHRIVDGIYRCPQILAQSMTLEESKYTEEIVLPQK